MPATSASVPASRSSEAMPSARLRDSTAVPASQLTTAGGEGKTGGDGDAMGGAGTKARSGHSTSTSTHTSASDRVLTWRSSDMMHSVDPGGATDMSTAAATRLMAVPMGRAAPVGENPTAMLPSRVTWKPSGTEMGGEALEYSTGWRYWASGSTAAIRHW